VKSLLTWFATCSIAILLTGCSSDRTATVTAAPAPAPLPPAKTQVDTYHASGPLVVENQVDVEAQREGVVTSIVTDVGTRVRKGQLLAQLDDRQLRADRDAADARVKSLAADLKHWQELSKVRYADLARAEEMWKAQLITAQQLEHDRYSAVGSKYEIERQQEDLRNAQETLRSLQLEMDKTRIVAPFDGVVARRYVRVGEKVATNDRLFWVTATSPLNVKFTLPEEMLGKVKPGEELKVTLPGTAGEEHKAKITSVSPVVDPSSGTIEVQAVVLGAPGQLRPGMTVDVSVKAQ
jgi:RND family efflux transporter MFP subunit